MTLPSPLVLPSDKEVGSSKDALLRVGRVRNIVSGEPPEVPKGVSRKVGRALQRRRLAVTYLDGLARFQTLESADATTKLLDEQVDELIAVHQLAEMNPKADDATPEGALAEQKTEDEGIDADGEAQEAVVLHDDSISKATITEEQGHPPLDLDDARACVVVYLRQQAHPKSKSSSRKRKHELPIETEELIEILPLQEFSLGRIATITPLIQEIARNLAKHAAQQATEAASNADAGLQTMNTTPSIPPTASQELHHLINGSQDASSDTDLLSPTSSFNPPSSSSAQQLNLFSIFPSLRKPYPQIPKAFAAEINSYQIYTLSPQYTIGQLSATTGEAVEKVESKFVWQTDDYAGWTGWVARCLAVVGGGEEGKGWGMVNGGRPLVKVILERK